MFFAKKTTPAHVSGTQDFNEDFAYMDPTVCYLDSACQTQRSKQVLAAEADYFTQYNACGGRVKYEWGVKVDTAVAQTRKNLLQLAGKSSKHYCVAFTLNTTYGINLLLHQIQAGRYAGITTSEIEHNSVLLPSLTWAKRNNANHTVLKRSADGSVEYTVDNLSNNIVVLNAVSNIDGRKLENIQTLTDDTHKAGGIVLIDAAQSFGHNPQQLHNIEFDAAFGSGHKMYGPSIGFIILKKSLIAQLEPFFIGGGTVSDVTENTYTLLQDDLEPHAVLEPGLQNWGGIIGLGVAAQWLQSKQSLHGQEQALAETLFTELQHYPQVHLLNTTPSPILSFYVDGIDSHRVALYLSQKNIMCRSGYFCCHSYLKHTLQMPPLVRISLGLHNTPAHVASFLDAFSTIMTTL